MACLLQGVRRLLILAAVGGTVWAGLSAKRVWPSLRLVLSASTDGAANHKGEQSSSEAESSVRLATPNLARRIGIETTRAETKHLAHHVSGVAETAYDARRTAKVYARVAGVVRELRAEPHQFVRKGYVLAVLDASVVGSNKAQYLAALAALELAEDTMKRVRELTREAVVPLKTEIEARTALNQSKSSLMDAEMKLRNLGFSDDDILQLKDAKRIDNLLEIAAPIDGYVVAWDVNIGEGVEATTQVFALVDTSVMWLWIDVYEADVAKVAIGQKVAFIVSGAESSVFIGEVAAVSREVNATTRTTRVRAVVSNPQGRLRARQFGRASIQVEPEHEAVIVPAVSVQREGTTEIVFVVAGEGVYAPRTVVTRTTDRRGVFEVIDGLKAGEEIVTVGSFVLYSQLHKEHIAEEVD